MKFLIPTYPNAVNITLKQDHEDVLVCFNNILVAYFSGTAGEFVILNIEDHQVEVLNKLGILFDNNQIKINKTGE